MQLLIDLATMAVMFPGGIPATDLSLVRGDKIPLRVTLLDEGAPVTPSGSRPALAVKTALGDETLVLAATNLEPVDDALGPAYVGSLSVNTTQLIAAMNSAASIDLIGEVVLIAGDGSQRTSSLIRVTVRQDILPADVIPPEDVLADWSALVADALAAQLPAALKEAGVELAAATGQSTLSSGDAADTWTIVGGYAMIWGDEILAGHLPDSCRLKSISTVYFFENPAANQYCLRIWRLTDGAYSLIGTSAYVSNLSSGQTATWVFTPGIPLTRGDVIIIQVCEGIEMTPYALGMHAVLTPSVPGRGLITEVSNPPAVNGTMAPLMTVVVDYDDGITLGGMELATARQLDSLGRDVRQSSATAEAAARTAGQSAAAASTAADNAATSATSAANSATAAANALAAIPQVDASGNMTLAGGLTAAGAINANGGINVPLAVGAPTNESGVNRLYAAGLAAVTDAFSVRCYPLPANCSSSNGTVFKTDKEPNSLYFNVPPNSSFTVKCGLVTNARPMHNYSSIRGWVAPVRLPAVSAKFTARFGQMTTVVRMGRDRDAFTLVPDQAAGGYRIGEIIDITFDHVRDAAAGGYHIRVREIYYSNAEQKWKMKTTQALAPETSSNNGYPVCVYAVVYEQYQDGGYDTEDRGALWLLHGGNSTRGCVKIATVRGVHCFENIYPFSGYYLDMENANSWALAGAFLPATMHLHCNNVNPAYYGFSSMESNIIVSEAVEDFVDPEAETTTED
ncbi:hypothetical protein [Akkermansia muciniphila]|uniref:hypothetical protein n=4 Tax=Akkermansia TaxID=239934 RepID=UPI001C0616B5|nr:hypothetical protein [Akkermansia muciniphila]QWP05058.1 hypothetical protein J5W77_10485 [Akkermansia muciniphila]QWP24772.1 hypothetical protein J5W81_02365 [Akkermansia muciniphila]QWP28852.1 hypothetical protein J5W80_10520 [Akkermansia muciniphila]